MKQEVFGNGHGKPGSSPSPVVKTRPNTNHTTTTNTTATARAARRSVKASRDEEELVRAARREENGGKREENGGKREEEIQRLRGEVEGLRSQVERLQQLNLELEQHKRALAQELLLAQGRIRHLQQQNNAQKTQTPRISNLSEQCKQEEESQAAPLKMASNTKPPSPPPPPPPAPNAVPRGVPPPPPPPPQQGPARMTTMNEATALVELYNSLTKRDVKKTAVVNGDVAISPHHNGIVGELQNRSTHLLAIKADVETKGEFINDLIKKVQTTTYTDMEQALTFVDWLDQQLSTLSDETAVLKHFNWPERKADALREAAFEYRNLKCVLTEVSSFSDDGTPTSCEATMRKISNLLDKLEKSMNRLMNLRNSVMLSYKEFRIPTDWMLDSGIASKMKLASVKLAKLYMKRVLQELDREMASEMLVAQSVRFTYRAHQFAGGLDSEAMRTFEELRERVRSQGR